MEELGLVQLGVKVDLATLKTQLDDARSLVAGVADTSIAPKLDLSALQRQLKQLRINVNDSQVQGAITRVKNLNKELDALRAVAPIKLQVRFDGETQQLRETAKGIGDVAAAYEKLKGVTQGLNAKTLPEVGVRLRGTQDTSKLEAWASAVGKVKTAAKNLTSVSAEVGVSATGATKAREEIEAVLAAAQRLQADSPFTVRVDVAAGDALADISTVATRLGGIVAPAAIRLQVDPSDALADIGRVEKAAQGIRDNGVVPLVVQLQSKQAGESLVALRERAKLPVALPLLLDTKKAREGLASFLGGVPRELAPIQLDANTQEASSKLQGLASQLAELTSKPYIVNVQVAGANLDFLKSGKLAEATRGASLIPDIEAQTIQSQQAAVIRDELLARANAPRRSKELDLGNRGLRQVLELLGEPAPPTKALRAELQTLVREAIQRAPDARLLELGEPLRNIRAQLQDNSPQQFRRQQEEQRRLDASRRLREEAQRRAAPFAFTPPATRPPSFARTPDSIINGAAGVLFPFNAQEVVARWQREGTANNLPANIWQQAVDRARTGQPDSFRTELLRRLEAAGSPMFGRIPGPPPASTSPEVAPFMRPFIPAFDREAFRRQFAQRPLFDTRVNGFRNEDADARTSRLLADLDARVAAQRQQRAREQLRTSPVLQEQAQSAVDLLNNRRRIQFDNRQQPLAQDNIAGFERQRSLAEENLQNARRNSAEESKAVQQLVKATRALTDVREEQLAAVKKATAEEEIATRDQRRAARGQQPFAERFQEQSQRRRSVQFGREGQELGLANALFGPFLAPFDVQPLRDRTQGPFGSTRTPLGVESLLGRRFLGNRITADSLNEAAGNALIGGAFPALFGQGVGASFGGFAGGAIGGLGGGILGFGGSLLGTGIGAAFDNLVTKGNEVATALRSPIENLEALADAGVIADRGLAPVVATLQSLGRGAEAAARVQQELAQSQTFGPQAAALTGRARDAAFRQPGRLATDLGGLLASGGNIYQLGIAQGLNDPNFLRGFLPLGFGEGLSRAPGAVRFLTSERNPLRSLADGSFPLLPDLSGEPQRRQGQRAEELAQVRTRQQRAAELEAARLRGRGFDSAASEQDRRGRVLNFQQEIARLRTERELTSDTGQRRSLDIQIARQRELRQLDDAASRADRQQRRRALEDEEFNLSGAGRVQAARQGRFGQARELAVATAEVDVARLTEERARVRAAASPAGDDALRLQNELTRATQATADATQRLADLQRQNRLELEQAVRLASRQVEEGRADLGLARRTSNLFRPGQSGSRQAVEQLATTDTARRTRDNALADLAAARDRQADPSEIATLTGAFDRAVIDYEAALTRSVDALRAANRSITEEARNLTRQLEDARTGQAVREGTDAGVNSFINEPNVVRNREERANRQLFSEAQRLTEQLGIKEGAPVSATFTGTTAERNAQLSEFISKTREELRGGEDIGRMQDQLNETMRSLAEVNGALKEQTEKLAGATTDLAGATNSLAQKDWNVYVNVNSGSVGGDGRVAQVVQ